MRVHITTTFAAFLVGLLAAVGTQAAEAAITYGPTVRLAYHGTGYDQRNFVQSSPNNAYTSVRRVSGLIPTSYVGINAYLYKGSALCRSSGTGYNAGGVAGYQRSTVNYCGAGTYRSQGIAYYYNTSNGQYNQYVSPSSPNLIFS